MRITNRLTRYALLYKRSIFLALLMLAIAVAADLTGPFIAKAMIDRHIVGIERTWYEMKSSGPDVVPFRGQLYERSDKVPAGARHGAAVTLIQAGRSFYFINQALPYTTSPTVADGKLTVRTTHASLTVPAVQLTRSELFAFYRPEIPPLWRLAMLYFGLIVVSAGFTYGQKYLLQVSANRVLQQMRQDVFAQIQRLPIRYFDSIPSGKIVSRITNDTEAIRDFYVTVLANVFSGIINMVGIYIALFILDVQLALITMLLVPLLAMWVLLYRKYAVKVNQTIRSLLSDINASINEIIQGVPIIRAFNREERTLAEFEELNNTYFRHQIRLLSINSASGFNLTNVLRNIFFIALLSYFGWRYFHLAGVISFGTLYAFVDYLNRLFQPVTGIVNQLANLEQARVSARRVFELLDNPGVDVVDGTIPRYRGEVKFRDVWFSYDGNKPVLSGISFTANQGQTVALVGHTGSGKSSIMNLLFRFYDADSGTITIDGQDITQLPAQHIRQHMGIVLQDPFLFTGTIASNVSLEDERVSREAVERALRDVGADQLMGHFAKGWDEPVMEKGSTLSAGQRQMISFARALAFNPAILVLDEATSSIDTETEAVIQDALDVLKRGRTTFIIAHRLSTIRSADLILVLEKGHIVERGTHEQLMETEGRYYQMYQTQLGSAV
ncbi:ABC transporter ATP-binding protein [Alicyclobacillus curvatus]|nr:ABC transporter ATP-binding protein [Alicyclobacillus curvatus]